MAPLSVERQKTLIFPGLGRVDRSALVTGDVPGVVPNKPLFTLFRDQVDRALLCGGTADLQIHYGITINRNNLTQTLARPGEHGFILGSDGNGRDVLTRLAYGGEFRCWWRWSPRFRSADWRYDRGDSGSILVDGWTSS
ncbi:MAG: hypothetical protein R2839_09155 [Thermomicrobiales bacterium]